MMIFTGTVRRDSAAQRVEIVPDLFVERLGGNREPDAVSRRLGMGRSVLR